MNLSIYKKTIKFILLTEKYFGIDSFYFFKNTFLSVVQRLVGLVTTLIIIYVFGHYTSTTIFGEYNYILSIIGLLGIFSLPGINNALIRSIANGHDKTYNDAFWFKTRFSIIGSIIILLFSIYYLVFKNEIDLFLSLLFLVPLFPFLHLFQLSNDFLVAKKEFKILTKFNVLTSIINSILIITAILLINSLPIIIFIQFFDNIIISIIIFLKTKKFIKNQSGDPDLYPYGTFLTRISLIPAIKCLFRSNNNGILITN